MAHPDPPAAPLPATPDRASLPKGLVLLALIVLLLFIGRHARSLWREWSGLQSELSRARQTGVIGYLNISPQWSYAARPEDWFRDEGDSTFLWGGWDSREGHHWFRTGRGDLDLEDDALSPPIGRDVFRAIDHPLFESKGGPIWGRIPAEARVVGFGLAGIEAVYPLLLLDKVQVVNDLFDRRPLLVTYNPLAAPGEAVDVYEAVLDGDRVTMGLSGYLRGNAPMLFDRGSESLWVGSDDALLAIAGPRKGSKLRHVARPEVVTWGDWRSRHPGSRLLIGAVRSPAKAKAGGSGGAVSRQDAASIGEGP